MNNNQKILNKKKQHRNLHLKYNVNLPRTPKTFLRQNGMNEIRKLQTLF